MPRTARDARLDTRNARVRLKPRREPYWRTIHEGLAVGYRKGARGGFWIARLYDPTHGRRFRSLGVADDLADRNGVKVLSFDDAQAAARAYDTEQGRLDRDLDPATGRPVGEAPADYTVRQTMADYLAANSHRGEAFKEAQYRINADILPDLGDLRLAKLTTRRIADWHRALAERGARKRGRKGGEAMFRAAPKTADDKRKRQASANRTLTILKAALNHAWKDGKAPSDDAWRRVAPFKNVEAPVIRSLSAEECRRLTNAADADVRPLIRAALLTGCRYAEITRLEARDVNLEANTLTIRTSKSGKARHVVLTEEAARFFEGMIADKTADALIFRKADGTVWGRGHQQRPLSLACKAAKITPAISFHVLRHTHGSTLAMQGVPMAVIAKQLGHADTRMTERHYAHLSPNYVAKTIRENFPTLGIVPKTNVAAIGTRKAG